MDLTPNAISRINRDEPVQNPVVQVIDLRRLQAQNAAPNATERYRLVLSDGVHFQQAMLATQLNELVKSNQLVANTVIRLTEFLCNTVHDRKIIIVLSCEALGQVDKIGAPVNIDAGGAGAAAGRPAAAAPAAAPAPAAPMASAPAPAPAMPKPHTSQPTITPQQGYGAAGGASGALTSIGGGIDPSLPIHPIASLNTFQNRWVIKARVTNKSDRRTWTNDRGSGCLFSVDLCDADGGEIRAAAFNDACNKLFPLFEIDKVYKITRGQLKIANRKFNSLNNQYEISMDMSTQVELVPDDTAIPKITFNFLPIEQLEATPEGTVVDVIGIVADVQQVAEITSRTSGKRFIKRNITLVDQSNKSVEVTLWGATAEQFSAPNFPVLACKGVRVSDFSGKSLSAMQSSIVQLDPEHDSAFQLRSWYDSVGSKMQATSLTGGGGGGGAAIQPTDPRKTLSQIKDEQLGVDGDVEFVTRAYVSFIKHDSNMLYYPACKNPDCRNKKVQEIDGNPVQFSCEKCGKLYDSCEYRYILSISVMDETASQWLSSFNETGQMLLGMTAEELDALKKNQPDQFEAVFARAMFKPYLFKIRAKTDRYQDENRVKCTVSKAQPVDFVQESRSLLDKIKALA